MRISFLAASFIFVTAAHAASLDQLSNEQKGALGLLFSGYSESFFCRKKVDFGVAGAFLKSKLNIESFSPEQAAELANISVGVHIAMMAKLEREHPLPTQKDAAEEAIKKHCLEVERAFGAHGEVIPGLLK